MSKDRIKIYVFELILIITLILALFKSNMVSNIIFAFILLGLMLAMKFGLKKRKLISVYSDQVIFLMVCLALIYLAIFYTLGLHFGFYVSQIKFGLWGLWHYIIPYTLIIVSSEVIRYILISQKNKESSLVAFISTILIDIIVYAKVYDLNNLEDILAIVGFVSFASISCNLFYNYMSKRFGYKAIIWYRLITILYTFIIPIIPNIYIYFRSIGRMVYPYIMYLILESTYAKTNLLNGYINKKQQMISTTVLFIIVATIASLISCKFYYGILVIGSGSMTGSINKGDAVVLEKYSKQKLREGQVIIFDRDDIKVVHRIVDIKRVNNEYHYFTKGDANKNNDMGYITDENILGIVKFRIPYIGYPTVWLKEIILN